MNRRPNKTVFLHKAGYRQRRIRDGIKLLPIVGVVLIMMPLAWPSSTLEEPDNASALTYIFGVWVVLIASAAILSGLLRSDETRAQDSLPEE